MGALLGSFIGVMVLPFVLLWVASSPKRRRGTAVTLEIVAPIVAILVACAAFAGAGSAIGFGGAVGSLLAVVVAAVWAFKQYTWGKPI